MDKVNDGPRETSDAAVQRGNDRTSTIHRLKEQQLIPTQTGAVVPTLKNLS